jgi:hypothetical protein
LAASRFALDIAEKCKIVKPDTRAKLRVKLHYDKMLMRMCYYSFYPLALACLFQFSFYSKMSVTDSRYDTAMTITYTSAAFYAVYLAWIVVLVFISTKRRTYEIEKKRRSEIIPIDGKPKEDAPIAKQPSTMSQVTVETIAPSLSAIEADYKEGTKRFWCIKLARHFVTACAVSTLAQPRPVQPVVILLVSIAYFVMSLCLRPYKNRVSNGSLLVYGVLAITNGILFIIYGTSSPFAEKQRMKNIGTAQLIINGLMALALFALLLGKSYQARCQKRKGDIDTGCSHTGKFKGANPMCENEATMKLPL